MSDDDDLDDEATLLREYVDVQRRWSEDYWTGLIRRTYREVGFEQEDGVATATTIEFYSRVKVDDNGTVTLGEWGGYYIQIMPMGWNSRLVMTPKALSCVYDHGWCFDRGPAAALAALVWDPQRQAEPHGFKKRIGSTRRLAGEQASRYRTNG